MWPVIFLCMAGTVFGISDVQWQYGATGWLEIKTNDYHQHGIEIRQINKNGNPKEFMSCTFLNGNYSCTEQATGVNGRLKGDLLQVCFSNVTEFYCGVIEAHGVNIKFNVSFNVIVKKAMEGSRHTIDVCKSGTIQAGISAGAIVGIVLAVLIRLIPLL